MATSSVALEAHITCCVCIDVYRLPQALKCLHTLCQECVDQLEKGGRVQCPECREYTHMADVKKDFKTAGLVDLYNAANIVSTSQMKGKIQEKQNQLCEMCDNADKCITWKCEDCEQYLCDMCERKHGKLKICKDHKITSIQDIVKISKAKMRETLQILKYEKYKISNKSNDIEEMIIKINKARGRQLAEIKQYKDEIIHNIEIHYKELIKTINNANDYSITNLTTLHEHYSRSENELQSHIQLVDMLNEGQDMSVFTEAAVNIQAEIRENVKHMKDTIPALYNTVSSPVNILYWKDWHPEDIVSVEVDYDKICVDQFSNFTFESNSTPVQKKIPRQDRYSELLSHNYKQVKQETVGHTLRRMCRVSNALWVLDIYGTIHIYNEDCELLKTLELNETARGITYSPLGNGSVIIAHDDSEGLHEHDIEGKHIADINTDGNFVDVFCDELTGKLYALLRGGLIYVLVFINVDGIWECESEIPTEYIGDSCCDRLWVYQDTIYISSNLNNCIYSLNTEGKLLWQVGERVGYSPYQMRMPELCGIDSEGNILVADFGNHNLQLYSPDTKKWGVLRLKDQPKFPRQAVIGVDGKHIWVITLKYLIKYGKKKDD